MRLWLLCLLLYVNLAKLTFYLQIHRRNQCQGEFHMRFLKLVFFSQFGTTACGADSVLAVIQAQYGVSAFFQLIIMSFGSQFFLGISGSVKGKCILAYRSQA